jgi:hypothetical protein
MAKPASKVFKSIRQEDSGPCWDNYKRVPGKKPYSPGSCVKESSPEDEMNEDLRKWFSKTDPEGGWKRINSKGEAIGPCAREPGEPKPKCMSNEKRASLTKKERASAVASKRKHDPNPERKGEPINVSNFGKGKISEDMEYLNEKNVPTSPEKWAQAKAQAKSKFDVYPSAYANGWAAKKYKEMGGGWKSVSEAKEKTEYDYEGDMARGQLQSVINNAQRVHDMLKDNDNLPEWVQSKITLAEDYISTVANYMMSEIDEEVEVESFKPGDFVKDVVNGHTHRVHKVEGNNLVVNKHQGKDSYGTFANLHKTKARKVAKPTNEAKEVGDDPTGSSAQETLVKKGGKTTVAKPIAEASSVAVRMHNALERIKQKREASEQRGREVLQPKKPEQKPMQKGVTEAFKPMDEPNYKNSIEARQKAADDNKPPFDGPYKKTPTDVTDKSGAVHTAQSRVRHLARTAMKAAGARQANSVGAKSMKESSLVESRKTEIIKDAADSAKKKKSVKSDKFEANPVLDSQIQKVDNT